MRYRALTLLPALAAAVAMPQAPLFDPGSVREIRLTFAQPDWRAQLEALYLAGEDDRLVGDISIDGTVLHDVGVRFKGYSSYSPGRVKNPFNIDLNHVVSGQHYQGANKLKLSNAFQDPSFLREVLSYEVARKYMPASRAAYANVYVNDTLQGLYTLVEDVGRDFAEAHFGTRDGSFFKGNPPTVDLTGENCSLSDNPGADSAAYYGIYSIQSDHGWGHLLELIDALNQHPDRIDSVLNVDRALWMHALNYALINFDSYVGYAQNYYLYRDGDGQWNTIPWDLNMSFGAFRLTDAGTYWNGFNINQAMAIDPLSHHNGPSVFPRPLMRALFADPMHRRMYIAHLRTLMQECIASGEYYQRGQALRSLIDAHVQADTNRLYSYQGFLDNLDQQVSFTIAYPGLKQLMDGRLAYLGTYPGYSGQPAIGTPGHAPDEIQVGGELTITAPMADADTAFLAYRFKRNGRFSRKAMLDDGQSGDGAAGDGIYGARILAEASLVEYFIYAENATAGEFSPQRAAHETHRILTRLAPGQLVINELMADNRGVVADDDGDAPDWIELYNNSGTTISTAGLYLSDDAALPTKWALPAVAIEPGGYLSIWADGSGGERAGFKLDTEGEALLLAYDSVTVIDQVVFGQQYPIYSWGRLPNGTGPFQRLTPTRGAYNRVSVGYDIDAAFQLWPNPAKERVYAFADIDGDIEVEVFRSDGRRMAGPIKLASRQLVELDTYAYGPGHYVVRVHAGDALSAKPFIVIP